MNDAHRLVQWYRANARPLPWRTETRDPYRTLVSELMLQQTRVERVIPRFEAFIDRFPNLDDLASAGEDDVLEAWSGLGYYRRARLLHRLAREVMTTSGELPSTAAELEKLPGIGPYTGAAVASLVFGEAAPVMDGNVARVGARVLGSGDDPRTAAGARRIRDWVRCLMEDGQPGVVNEALMELGARVCTPTNPACGSCPFQPGCIARSGGRPEAYPPARPRGRTVRLEWLAAIAEDCAGRWLLKKVAAGPILRGLWLPPLAEVDRRKPLGPQATALLPAVGPAVVETLEPVRHSITHRRIDVIPARLRVNGSIEVADGWAWADPRDPKLPTSSLLGKLLRSAEN